MIRGIRFIYLFRHFNLTPVRNLDCTSSLQPAPVLLHLPVCLCVSLSWTFNRLFDPRKTNNVVFKQAGAGNFGFRK